MSVEQIFIDLTHSSSDEEEEATKPIVIEDSEEEEANEMVVEDSEEEEEASKRDTPRITVDDVVRKIKEEGSYAHFRKQFPEHKYKYTYI